MISNKQQALDDLQQHLQTSHPLHNPYNCPICLYFKTIIESETK